VGRAMRAGQRSPYLLAGAAAELQQVFADSSAETGYQFADEMLEGSGPERQLLQRMEQCEVRQAAALQAALGLAEPLSLFFCDHELRRAGEGVLPGRLRGWCNSFYRWAY